MNGIKNAIRIYENSMPLVSIVTPSYNHGKFIEKTIRSVLNQDYPRIEHIVVDAVSSDDTLCILRKYEGKIKWLSEKDKGTEDAINKGFRMSEGEILGTLNADDFYLPGAVPKIVGFFSRYPKVKMVYGKGYYADMDGNFLGEFPTGPFNYRKLAVSNFICQPSVFFRREIFYETGGYTRNLKLVTDLDLWIRIAQRHKIEYLPEFISALRLHKEAKNILPCNALTASEEVLNTVMNYYNWAPANRVYGYCYNLVLSKMHPHLRPKSPLILFLALLLSIKEYIRLNRGIRLEDIKLITPRRIKKLFIGWECRDVLKELEKKRKIGDSRRI